MDDYRCSDTTGYLGGPYYKIVLAGTERALAAIANGEVITVPKFSLVHRNNFGESIN
jgi:hypothetical protein